MSTLPTSCATYAQILRDARDLDALPVGSVVLARHRRHGDSWPWSKVDDTDLLDEHGENRRTAWTCVAYKHDVTAADLFDQSATVMVLWLGGTAVPPVEDPAGRTAAERAVVAEALRTYAAWSDEQYEADPSDYNAGRADAATEAINRAFPDRSAGRWCEECQQVGAHHSDRHPEFARAALELIAETSPETEQPAGSETTYVHDGHPPYEPLCNERRLPGGQLRGACLNDDGSPR